MKNLQQAILIVLAPALGLCAGCQQQAEQPEVQIKESDFTDSDIDLEAQLDLANRFVAQDRSFGRAYVIRSQIYRKLDRIPEQVQDLASAIKCLEDDPDEKLMLIECCYAKGLAHQSLEQDDWAIEEFNRTLKLSPHYHSVIEARAFSFFRLEQFDKALDDVDELIGSTQSPAGYELRSWIHRAMGNDEMADEDMKLFQQLRDQAEQLPDDEVNEESEDKPKIVHGLFGFVPNTFQF